MVLPFQVFVRIVINQRKRNTVPRMSFSQEIIAMFLQLYCTNQSFGSSVKMQIL